jgi:tetratricopeptide (TPR) repeat protein
VGKTQLAIEYAHRFASAYDLVWWIAAEQAWLIGGQFAELAAELWQGKPRIGLEDARRAVFRELRQRSRWLLVFDNADSSEDVARWLPGGSGHVLITSRAPHWTEIAVRVEVDVLARVESITILRDRLPKITDAEADQAAEALGDLPLGITQAAGYMADTGTPVDEYLGLLETRAGQVLDLAPPVSYSRSLVAVTQLAFDQLSCNYPAAAAVVGVCAFLAPDPVPSEWFTRDPAQLPTVLADCVLDPVRWRQTLARIGAQALARIEQDGLRMHRLTQAILRAQLPPDEASVERAVAEMIVSASRPGDFRVPSNWHQWALILPHLLALDPASTTNLSLRQLAIDSTWYLIRRGDFRNSYRVASHFYERWLNALGPDESWTLAAARAAATALWGMGRHVEGRQLSEDSFMRERRLWGDSHPDTLTSATTLANILRALGQIRAARELHEDTFARRRRVLGEDHPDTLGSANNLAVVLRRLGEMGAARELHEDTFARRRRVLGEDHPDTLVSANNLAAILRRLGQIEQARELHEDTFARRRRVLGEDHPDTLVSATNLVAVLRAVGETRAARELHEDTLARRRRVLGEDHIDSVKSASRFVAAKDDDDDDDFQDYAAS